MHFAARLLASALSRKRGWRLDKSCLLSASSISIWTAAWLDAICPINTAIRQHPRPLQVQVPVQLGIKTRNRCSVNSASRHGLASSPTIVSLRNGDLLGRLGHSTMAVKHGLLGLRSAIQEEANIGLTANAIARSPSK